MRIKNMKICVHGFFEYQDEYFPRAVVANFIQAKGAIFKNDAHDVDLMIIGRPNYNTKMSKRSKLKMQADRKIRTVSAIAFFHSLSASDKALLRIFNANYSVKKAA